MKTHVSNSDDDLAPMRIQHTRSLEAHLAAIMTETMIAEARAQGGMVPTPQLAKMCGHFATACARAVMGEVSTVQATITVSPESLPTRLRGATTQAIIDHHCRPLLAEAMAATFMEAGLGYSILQMKKTGLDVDFAAWTHAFRNPEGPAARTDDTLHYEQTSVHRDTPQRVPAAPGEAAVARVREILATPAGSHVEDRMTGSTLHDHLRKGGPRNGLLGRDGGDR